MEIDRDLPAAVGYALGAAGFLLLSLQLAFTRRSGWRAGALLAASAASAAWAAAGAWFALGGQPFAWAACRGLDAVRVAAWLGFAASLLIKPEASGAAVSARRFAFGALGVGAMFALAAGLLPLAPPVDAAQGRTGHAAALGAWLAISVLGLLVVEQLFRRTPAAGRWHIRPLCLGLGGAFAFDLFAYSHALLFGRLDPDVWSARGPAHALVIPFVMLAAARNRDWKIDLAVSREVVFQSTALAASGVYLLAVAAAGYYVRYFGGTWGRTIQITLLFGAALLLAFLFSSGTLRAKLRVLINKHFFSYRYDYREEWLRFTRLLSMSDSHLGLRQRCVKALADLVESPAGSLWLERGDEYWQACTWNAAPVPYTEPRAGALIGYLRRTGWVVDLEERRAHPGRYPNLQPPAWLEADRDAWLVVPLATGEQLLGFVVLQTPRTRIEVNWEVRDVLKTAALQAATFLAQMQASEALLEARKFEAFNRMSAFVVHDLKNLVAQLSLLLGNARRHADNPEFRKDMLATVEHVVERMNHLLLQLRSGSAPIDNARPVRLAPLVQRVVAGKLAQGRSIGCDASADVVALGHEDRLERVLGHLVQNALDATAGGGEVQVRLAEEAGRALVEIKDSGIGMSPEFVRDRLFKPFSTTKRSGMGIGAYESERYVAELGGQIHVDSASGVGTTIRVLLPRAGLTLAARHGAMA